MCCCIPALAMLARLLIAARPAGICEVGMLSALLMPLVLLDDKPLLLGWPSWG